MNARVVSADLAKSLPVSLAWRERPFDGPLHHVKIASHGNMPTIAEILESTDGLPRGFMDCGEVRINGECVPRERWRQVRPRPIVREIAITLHMRLRDPGGGGSSGAPKKNTIALVATIAVLLVAAAVSGGAAAAFIPAGYASLAGAGIAIGGKIKIAATFPTPSEA